MILLRAVCDATGLSSTQKCTAMILAAHCNPMTRQCYLSLNTLAVTTGLRRRTAMRAVQCFVDRGLVSHAYIKLPLGGVTASLYTFHLDAWLSLSDSRGGVIDD